MVLQDVGFIHDDSLRHLLCKLDMKSAQEIWRTEHMGLKSRGDSKKDAADVASKAGGK
jgi:hypothetical protein